jgi:hypothetical protein
VQVKFQLLPSLCTFRLWIWSGSDGMMPSLNFWLRCRVAPFSVLMRIRIAERSHDPKRREALKKLLNASRSGKQPGNSEGNGSGVGPVSVQPPAPPVPIVVPQLPVTPVLEARAQYDDARKLNRAVMWEELVKTQAARWEAPKFCVGLQCCCLSLMWLLW